MTRFEVVVRYYLIVDAAHPAAACDQAKLRVGETAGPELAMASDYQAVPYVDPQAPPPRNAGDGDREYHP